MLSMEMVRLIMAEPLNIRHPFQVITKITQQYENDDILNRHAHILFFPCREYGLEAQIWEYAVSAVFIKVQK